MKKLVVLSMMLIFSQAVMAQIVTNSGLERLERKIFQRTYNGETYEKRLDRLEQKLFGAEQSGNVDDRFITLRSAAKNYKTYNPYYDSCHDGYYANSYPYGGYQAPLFTYGQGSNWRRTMWNNFRNYAGIGAGMPTGITPAMDPAYMDWFEADRAAKNEYYQTNHGYRNFRTNSGTGTGVTVLD